MSEGGDSAGDPTAGVTLERYAELGAELALDARRRDEILAREGLDEERWAAIDERFHSLLEGEIDAHDQEGVPDLVARYADLFAAAQRRLVGAGEGALLPLQTFAEAMRALQRGDDFERALGRLGISLAEFVRASEHWTRRMVDDPEARERYQKLLGPG